MKHPYLFTAAVLLTPIAFGLIRQYWPYLNRYL